MRDSLRFTVMPDFADDVTLRTVVVDLLTGKLGLTVRQILCLQDFPQQRLYDVTFISSEVCWNTYEGFKKLAEDPIGRKFSAQPLFMQEEKVITVHLYNPFADVNLVKAFLANYCEDLRGGDRVMNKFGIWSGKYRFVGRFITDKDCIGGVKRPPAVFSIGGERGFLFYPGQPRYCRKCLSYGHTNFDCEFEQKCRFCGKEGHLARDCTAGRVCDICKTSGHLAKQCGAYHAARDWYNPEFGRSGDPKQQRERQRRPSDVWGGSAGVPAGEPASSSGDPPTRPASEAAEEKAAEDAAGVSVTAVTALAAESGDRPEAADAVRGEDGAGMKTGVVSSSPKGEEERRGGAAPGQFAGSPSGGGGADRETERELAALGISFSPTDLVGSLSDSMEEEEVELESVSSLEDAQRLVEETDISDVPVSAANKRARAEKVWSEEMEGQESEEESTCSPVQRRRVRSQECPEGGVKNF